MYSVEWKRETSLSDAQSGETHLQNEHTDKLSHPIPCWRTWDGVWEWQGSVQHNKYAERRYTGNNSVAGIFTKSRITCPPISHSHVKIILRHMSMLTTLKCVWKMLYHCISHVHPEHMTKHYHKCFTAAADCKWLLLDYSCELKTDNPIIYCRH